MRGQPIQAFAALREHRLNDTHILPDLLVVAWQRRKHKHFLLKTPIFYVTQDPKASPIPVSHFVFSLAGMRAHFARPHQWSILPAGSPYRSHASSPPAIYLSTLAVYFHFSFAAHPCTHWRWSTMAISRPTQAGAHPDSKLPIQDDIDP